MTDYTSDGAVPVEDSAVDDPPTVDEVLEEQRRRDDLPDPSDDPTRQQVVEAGDDSDELRQLLTDQQAEDQPREGSGADTDADTGQP